MTSRPEVLIVDVDYAPVEVAASLNRRIARGRPLLRATLDILGEDIHNLEQAQRAIDGYIHLVEQISRQKVEATISIKLTQLGLKVDPQACMEMADRLVRRARELNNFVRIDMEDSSCTTDTLRIYRELRKDHSNVGRTLSCAQPA